MAKNLEQGRPIPGLMAKEIMSKHASDLWSELMPLIAWSDDTSVKDVLSPTIDIQLWPHFKPTGGDEMFDASDDSLTDSNDRASGTMAYLCYFRRSKICLATRDRNQRLNHACCAWNGSKFLQFLCYRRGYRFILERVRPASTEIFFSFSDIAKINFVATRKMLYQTSSLSRFPHQSFWTVSSSSPPRLIGCWVTRWRHWAARTGFCKRQLPTARAPFDTFRSSAQSKPHSCGSKWQKTRMNTVASTNSIPFSPHRLPTPRNQIRQALMKQQGPHPAPQTFQPSSPTLPSQAQVQVPRNPRRVPTPSPLSAGFLARSWGSCVSRWSRSSF